MRPLLLTLLGLAAAGLAEGGEAKGRGPAAPTCATQSPSTSGRVELRQLFLWPVQGSASRPTRYRFLACMAAPEGQVRTRHGLSLVLFRRSSGGHFYSQGGQKPCHPRTPAPCRSTSFAIEAEDLRFSPGSGDTNPPSPADMRVLANLSWVVDGVEHVRRSFVTACPWPKGAQQCPALDEQLVMSRP